MADEKVPSEELMLTTELTGTLSRPAELDPSDQAGLEGITRDEIQLPRLTIAQGLSPQLVPGEGTFIQGLSIGQMFNDVTSEIYGNGPLTVVPVQRHVTRIEFDPENRRVPLDRNVPADDPRMFWNGDEPPRATEFVEFVCVLLRPGKAPERLVVSIKTTNKQMRAAAKLWTTFIMMRGTAIYSGMYHLTAKIEKGKNKDGQDTMYGVFIVKNAGFIPLGTPAGKAVFEFAKQFHESLEGKVINVTREAGSDDDVTFDTVAMDADKAPTGTKLAM